MTHWRQTGIVPASDGEDSDAELSTQEDDVDVFQLVSQFVPPDTSSRHSTPTESAQLHDENQDARGVEAEVEPETVPMDVDTPPSKQRSQETVKKAPIMMMDLAYPDDDEVDEYMDLDDGGIPATKSQTSNITPHDTPRFGSPDPITGELQPLSGLVPQFPRGPTETPLIAPPVSPSPSSPLSSAPSNLSTPSAPPQAATADRPAIGFAVVIPTEQPDAPVIPPDSPNYQRSLRQRKPIQMHPYLLEDAKYKAHMRERGVQPVRIQYSQTEAPSRPANDDSQDGEFPAPPVDDDSQPRRNRRQKSKEQDGRISPRRNSLPARHEVPTTAQRGDSNKRRKTGHLSENSRASLSGERPSIRQPENMNTDQDNVDVYNMPDSPSPTRLPRPTLGKRSANPRHTAGDAAIPSSGTVKRVGLLSLLNDSDDSDESPPLPPPQMPSSPVVSSPRTRTATPIRKIPPIVASIGSSPEPAADPTTIPSEDDKRSSSRSESESGGDDDMLSTAPMDPGKSKIVSRFAKKGMRGVLPASFIRLNKPRAPQEPPESHRHDRHSATPSSPEVRPGVARSKVSSRLPSRRVNDLFPGDNDSDSGNEPVLLSSVPARKEKPKKTPSARPIDLEYDSDIPEDNRFDPGGSGAKRSNTSTRRPKKTSQSTSGQKRASSSRTQNQGSRRATTGAPRAKRPAGPSVGIVDAYRYARTIKTPMPDFARLAAREASRRPNQGRQSPRRKLFVMDNAQDTRDVQDVLRDWREGTLPFRAPSPEIPQTDAESRDEPMSTAQTRLPSPERFGGSTQRAQSKKLPSIRRSTGSSKPRQTSLLNHFPNEPAKAKPRASQSVPKPLAINSKNKSYIAHRPTFEPQPAQIERVLPPGQQVAGWRGRLEDFADTLQRRISTKKAVARRRAPLQPPASRVDVPLTAPNRFTRTALPQSHRVRRKGTPRRIDADAVEHRQPTPEALVLDDYFAPAGSQPVQLPRQNQSGGPQKPRLSGLLAYGHKYSLNFDIHPLRNSVYFNSDTSIGRGDLTKALGTAPARVSGFTVAATFTFCGEVLRWGVYEDNVATQFESVMGKIGGASERLVESPNDDVVDLETRSFEQQAYYFFGFVVGYIADALTFHDPLDVIAFGQRFLQAIEHCCERGVIGSAEDSLKQPATKLAMRANAFGLLIARQIQLLTAGEQEIQEKLELPRILQSTGRQLVSRLVRCRFNCIRECYEDQRHRVQFEQGIGPENFIVEIWVVAVQMLTGAEPESPSFWALLNEQLQTKAVETSLEVQTFEKLWKALFTVLPLFQFDDAGMALGVGEHNVLQDNWELVRILTARPLKVYNANREGQSGTINTYTRLLFARAHHLMTRWYWSNPEKIIPTIYDFFGSTGLKMLKNEEHHGSPDFIMNLDKSPSLEAHDSDACFHLLLKAIAIGLQQMKARNVKKKTFDNIVNRLMPNHRRQYPKDEDLSYSDLAILRNHHDLMVTLYWAAPPASRPPIDAIQLLINPESTHIGACHVVVRAWSNMIRFQLHSGEGPEQLVVLMEWFDYLVTKLLGQHQAARSDAEKQLAAAKANGDLISDAHFEENVKQNQRKVEAVLNDLVKSLRLEMANIPGDVQSAVVLLTKDSTATILKASTRWSHKLMLEVLQLIRQFVLTCRETASPPAASTVLQQSNEESQDYGDVSIFENFEFDGDAPVDMVHDEKRAAEHLLTQASGALYQLLSNCFGADKQPEEVLLTNTVDTWCLVAGFLVKNGFRSWDTYLRHGTESWSSLRDTPQTRKFTSYFMPKIIEYGGPVYEENRSDFLLFWMKALVERDSMLAFQNQYTSTLLNCDEANPILANPPFARDPSSGKYRISQLEFRSGRLGLISSVLERMRTSFEGAVGRDSDDLKREYAELLREMMNGMKENYQELQASTHTGDYVKFAHGVIESLQQHTTEIVAVDKFFTENSAFPLPANDPNYVVGRLKKYAAKLSQPRSQYQLNSFFQSQCERTALTGTQDALVQHITDAVDAEHEHGDTAHPTLRAYLLHCLFPVYMKLMFCATAGWVVAIPLLQSLQRILTTLDTAVDTSSPGSLLATTQILDTTLASLRLAVSSAIHSYRKDTFEDPLLSAPLLTALTLLIRTTTISIPSISRYHHLSDAADSADFILRAAHYAITIINPREDITLPGPLPYTPSPHFAAARKAAQMTIIPSITRQWGKADGAFYFQRGNQREPLHPPHTLDIRTARRGLVEAVHELFATAARSETFRAVAHELAPEITGEPEELGLEEVFV